MNTPEQATPAPRRWQFSIRRLLAVTTLAAVVLAGGSTIGWPSVLRAVRPLADVRSWTDVFLIVLCIAHLVGPMLAFFAWLPVRRRSRWLRVSLPALPLALLLATMAAFLEAHNPDGLVAMLHFTAVIWPPQILAWWVAATFVRYKEKPEERQSGPLPQSEYLDAVQAAFLAELNERTRGNTGDARAADPSKQGDKHARVT